MGFNSAFKGLNYRYTATRLHGITLQTTETLIVNAMTASHLTRLRSMNALAIKWTTICFHLQFERCSQPTAVYIESVCMATVVATPQYRHNTFAFPSSAEICEVLRLIESQGQTAVGVADQTTPITRTTRSSRRQF